ncbi:hypothetical protein [Piscinibacter sakaiensis]|uniref:Transcription factor zinc-finger domain-containing protein n=1 Tax=Piscinibacter sakaiensis TaxID=1547922 RepID=A0A0K8NXX0_PISS1|nr:hypothetical protein [Piscinibacter sakaiensis]GAP34775.1 hypothetical protein ISF6_0174 [Piscinibacter sakaiensis]
MTPIQHEPAAPPPAPPAAPVASSAGAAPQVGSAVAPPAADGPACGNCGEAMQALVLAGHYGARVELDLCAGCHLLWFDGTESARLAGPGVLRLLGDMAQTQRVPHRVLRGDLGCLRCGRRTATVHNRSRWGPSLQLGCPERHGAYQSFAQYLGEKGYARALSSADRARLEARDGGLGCVNCGGRIAAGDAACPWCGSVPALIDLARLAQALDPEGAIAPQRVHGLPAQPSALACLACGSALPATPRWDCPQCGATLAAAGLDEAWDALRALEPALLDHQRRPAAAVVRRRLAAQAPAMERQRAWAQAMQAEADARHGGPPPTWDRSRRLGLRGWIGGLLAIVVVVLLRRCLGEG